MYDKFLCSAENGNDVIKYDLLGLQKFLQNKYGTAGREFLFDGKTLIVRHHPGFAIMNCTIEAITKIVDDWADARSNGELIHKLDDDKMDSILSQSNFKSVSKEDLKLEVKRLKRKVNRLIRKYKGK
jgi:hypothetical protein